MKTKTWINHSNQPARPARWRSPRAGVVTALITILVISGCGSPDSPPNIPTSSATNTSHAAGQTPQTSASPSAAYQPATANGPALNVPVPVLPDAAKEFSKAGLEEFARYWYSTLTYAYETGDSGPMMAITDPACMSCEKVKKTVSSAYANGGWLVGGQMTVHSSTSNFQDATAGTYQAIVTIQQKAVSSYTAKGSLEESLTAKIARPDIIVATYQENHWTAQTAEHLTKN
ncbi:DUF6318 family protein [Arthrobacter cryoconiti]|nr:DUF6318 family protein [Arthrobacter cryoconiti]